VSPLFLLFWPELTAGGIPLSAEILGYHRFGQRENSDVPRCFPLFPAVFVECAAWGKWPCS
jgi:hypothetical protein